MPHPDVVIAGAGPAGSVAAIRLARAGARVHMFDRAVFPREKLCGDTLNPGSLALLDRLGIGAAVRDRALATTGMTVTGPGSEAVSAHYPDGFCGAALMRRDLDLLLVEAAIEAGARFEPGVTVREPLLAGDGTRVGGVRVSGGRGGSDVPARIVIAADGRGSRLASRLGISRFAASPRRWAYGAYFAGVHELTSRGEMHVRRGGYIGVAPLPGGLANVCVVTTPASVPPSDRADPIPSVLASDDLLRERFRDARRLSPTAVLGPLAVEARSAGRPGLLLAGDAAGFVDPMTGDGMRFALRGGELAAEAALRELDTGTPAFDALRQARSREFAGKWRLNRALRTLVDSPAALSAAAALASRWSAPLEYLIGVAGDVALARHPPSP